MAECDGDVAPKGTKAAFILLLPRCSAARGRALVWATRRWERVPPPAPAPTRQIRTPAPIPVLPSNPTPLHLPSAVLRPLPCRSPRRPRRAAAAALGCRRRMCVKGFCLPPALPPGRQLHPLNCFPLALSLHRRLGLFCLSLRYLGWFKPKEGSAMDMGSSGAAPLAGAGQRGGGGGAAKAWTHAGPDRDELPQQQVRVCLDCCEIHKH